MLELLEIGTAMGPQVAALGMLHTTLGHGSALHLAKVVAAWLMEQVATTSESELGRVASSLASSY